MRKTALLSATVLILSAAPAIAQDWTPFMSPEDGFSATYPGAPKVEATTYRSEYRQVLPAKIYTASDKMGTYSTTVVDYRGAQRLHDEMAATCRAAKGKNGQDGDACQNDFRVEVAGAMDYAAWNLMKPEGTKVTHYMWYFNEMVAGRLIQVRNPDQTRTFAVIHQHDGRLYIHKATVGPRQPEPILFQQNLGFVTSAGKSIRYREFYTEGYGEWKFPSPPPARTERDFNTNY